MKTHPLGSQGPRVSVMGLGCMGLSGVYGSVDRKVAIATIHAALDAGINLLDTGDFYNSGHNELLIRDALARCDRQSVLLSVKFGELRDPAGGWHGKDCRPEAVRNFLAHSLNRLGTDYIDIYRPARLDPAVPIEETVGAIADMVKAGYVRHIGLSEVGPETIRRAAAVHPIVDLQIEYSLVSRHIEEGILDTCRELGIGLTVYGILSRGLFSGRYTRGTQPAGRYTQPYAAFRRPKHRPQSLTGSGVGGDRRFKGHHHRPARHGMGSVPGRRPGAAGRCQGARTIIRSPGCAGRLPHT